MKSKKTIAAVMAFMICGTAAVPCIQPEIPSFSVSVEAVDSLIEGFTHEYDAANKTLTVKWNKVKKADAYKVSIKRKGDTQYKAYKTVKGTSCAVAKVKDGEKISVKITVLKKDGDSYRSLGSNAFSVNANAVADEGVTISGLAVAKNDKNSVTLEWKAAEGAGSYVVCYKTADAKKFKKAGGKVSLSGGKASIKITGLSKGTKYVFRVVPVVGGKEGKAAETTFTTKAGSTSSESTSGSEIKKRAMPDSQGYTLSSYIEMLKKEGFKVNEIPKAGKYEVYYNGLYSGQIILTEGGGWYVKA